MSEGKPSKRELNALARRQKVLESALVEFLANGFTATRVEDVAARAGVAKGTVYLYCKDKEELFAHAIRNEISPVVGQLHGMLEDMVAPPREAVELALGLLLHRATTTRLGDVMRLILGEALRFPELTLFYRNEVVMPAVQRMAGLLQRARKEGALRVPSVADFPHLAIAPILMLVLAGRVAPQLAANPEAMLKVHLDNLFTS